MRSLLAASALLFVTSLAQADAVAWTYDASHSRVGFSVTHLVVSTVSGRFNQVTKSNILLDEADLTKSKAEIEIAAASIDTGDAKRDEHLKSPDFFDVKKFPTLTFKSKSITKTGDGYRVDGALKIRDVEKPVTLSASVSQPVKTPWGKQVRSVKLGGKIKRSEFGLTWNKGLETGGVVVGDEVTLDVQVELAK
jgi:polyisoprenoid-binding protein YceI